MSCEIKTPFTSEDGILLPRNGKFVYMEAEIVMFVVKGSVRLTVPPDRQEAEVLVSVKAKKCYNISSRFRSLCDSPSWVRNVSKYA